MTETALKRIEIYDTTLRDGAQGLGVAFSLTDKLQITEHLDALGVNFIEGGYPLSNPKDAAYFEQAAKIRLKHAKLCAFGMTRRKGVAPSQDNGMIALVASQAPIITIVGKSWDLHVDEVLRVQRQENLDMIHQSVEFCHKADREVFYDAEHFFDGYRDNPEYALQTLKAAIEGGATCLILCDTNGGSLPDWIHRVVTDVSQELGCNGKFRLGIHTHNDCGVAVANSMTAIAAGAVHVQGTINGLGERCGNADLTTIIANLRLKLNYDCLQGDSLAKLTETSRFVYALANMNMSANQPFVGSAAFAHKGGMHVHAVQRMARSYEHVEPERVGNVRRILVSELSGASNITATLGQKFHITDNKEIQRQLLERVQGLENQGYQFEAAMASYELLLHQLLGTSYDYWQLDHYRCVILKRNNLAPITEATVKLEVNHHTEHRVAEGDGPVNALDAALRKCLQDTYPQLANVHLYDYRVRVVNPTAESAAKVRVVAQFAVRPPTDGKSAAQSNQFATVGVNENIIDASWQAIIDAFRFHLIESGVKPTTGGLNSNLSP